MPRSWSPDAQAWVHLRSSLPQGLPPLGHHLQWLWEHCQRWGMSPSLAAPAHSSSLIYPLLPAVPRFHLHEAPRTFLKVAQAFWPQHTHNPVPGTLPLPRVTIYSLGLSFGPFPPSEEPARNGIPADQVRGLSSELSRDPVFPSTGKCPLGFSVSP